MRNMICLSLSFLLGAVAAQGELRPQRLQRSATAQGLQASEAVYLQQGSIPLRQPLAGTGDRGVHGTWVGSNSRRPARIRLSGSGNTRTPFTLGSPGIVSTARRQTHAGVLQPARQGSWLFSLLLEEGTTDSYWAFHFTREAFVSFVDSLGNQAGYRIRDLDVYGVSETLYAGTWIADGRNWAVALGFDLAGFVELLRQNAATLRITDIEAHVSEERVDLAGVWVEDSLAWAWGLNFTDADEYVDWINQQVNDGLMPIDLEILLVEDTLRYSVLLAENVESHDWAAAFDFTWDEFQPMLEQHRREGRRLIDYDVYVFGDALLFSVIWLADGRDGAYALNIDGSLEQFVETFSPLFEDRFIPLQFSMIDLQKTATSVHEHPEPTPNHYELLRNYPNPFNPQTTVVYRLTEPGRVKLRFFTVTGAEVAAQDMGLRSPGMHRFIWEARDSFGRPLPAGLYLVELLVNGHPRARHKMLLLR